MKQRLLFLILLALLLSGCAGPAVPAADVVDCRTPLDPAAADPAAAVMPRQSDLPEGFKPVACDRLVEDEGFSAMTAARLYGVTQGWPNHLAVFNNDTQKLYVFVAAPIYTEDRQTLTNIIRKAEDYAYFRQSNTGMQINELPTVEKFGFDQDLGDQFIAFAFAGAKTELNLKPSQPVQHDLVLVRRGGVLFGIESVYGTLKPPAVDREKLLKLAATLDKRLESVVSKNEALGSVRPAPTPDWTTTVSDTAQKYSSLTAGYPNLPQTFSASSEQANDLITLALGSWMGRAVSYAQYSKPDAAGELVQAVIIYPLDAQEQEMFRRLLGSRDQIAAYLFKPLVRQGVLSANDDITQFYHALPAAEALNGAGDAAGGFTLNMGELQDSAFILSGQALAVVTVTHPTGTEAPVNAAQYAAWLASQIKQTPAR